MEDRFLLELTITNLQSTVGKLPELERQARNGHAGPFYAIGYLKGSVVAALARLEAFVAANPK